MLRVEHGGERLTGVGMQARPSVLNGQEPAFAIVGASVTQGYGNSTLAGVFHRIE